MIRILHVDDEKSLIDLTKIYLEKKGEFRVTSASSVSEALKILESDCFDVILSDYEMPHIDGIEFLKTLKAGGDPTPFIIFSGRGREDVLIEAINNGADFYLQKGGKPTAQFAELKNMIFQAYSRKKAEIELKKSEERYRAVVESQTELICRFLPDGTIGFVNDAFCRYYGLDSQKIVGEIFVPNIPDSEQNAIRSHLKSLTPENPFDSIEHRIILPDGSVRWQQWNDTAIFDERGNISEYQSVGRDMTDQKLMEEWLQEKVNYVQALMYTIPAPVFYRDVNGVYHDCNKAFEELVGLPRSEIVGKNIHDFFNKDLAEWYAKMDREIIDSPHLQQYEYQINNSMGEILDVLFSKTARYRADGTVDGIVGVIVDISDRKKMEKSINEEINFIQALKDTIPAPFFFRDEYGIYHDCNKAFEELVGLSRDEIIGKDIHHFFNKDFADFYAERDREILNNPHLQQYEYRINNSDGEIFDVMFSKTAKLRADGTVDGIVGVILDISQRKNVERDLKREINFIQALKDTIPAPVFYRDINGIYHDCNKAFEELVGLSKEEILGRNIHDFFNDDLADLYSVRDKEIIDNPHLQQYEHKINNSEGEIIDVMFSKTALHNPDGSVAGIVGVILDISRRTRMEEALRGNEEMMRTLADYTYDWESWVGPDSSYIYISPSCERITGYKPEEFMADPMAIMNDIVHPDDLEMLIDHYSGIDENNTDVAHFDFRIILPDGGLKWISHYCQPVYHEDGTWAGRRETKRDITQRKLAEEQLSIANSKLNLLSNVTRHDVLNQVTAVLGYLELIREFSGRDDDVSEMVSKIEILMNTIQHQLLFTKDYQEIGITTPVWQDLDSCIWDVSYLLDLNDSEVFVDVGSYEILADNLLKKVFYNFAENSLRHGGGKLTEIRFTTEEENGFLKIIYEDNGGGILYADKDKIMLKGFGKNTGYGLFLSHNVLSMTGMSLRECGVPGEGVRFEITVPAGNYRVKSSGT
ncbi:PAS domain S-box protein [Methanoplanus limicola]|uniref:histidine kinase n=1 Tax=Methanoplanus limicola DSM 2279 TaxID=937775 RepID=H1YXJ5_9EURY|nr:PAS domain S-box protein [Methanoplanus limicola]EHQ34964.1 putative PAS/PAC sensor protein [Methanoplanus limicola DSM 2279]